MGEWNLLEVKSRETVVDLRCSACHEKQSMQIFLPEGATPCWPLERLEKVAVAIEKEVDSFAERMRKHVSSMPAAQFATHPLWADAQWCATTFQWHPMSEAPPLMGLVFENEEAGLDIFRSIEDSMNHEDRFEEIRISIIEGAVSGQEHRPGYSVHLCADPEALEAHATFDEFVVDRTIVPFLGQWNRHYPIPGQPSLLAKFKEEFEKHQEFMLAPTVLKDDGNRYMVPELGIIKNLIHFRQLSDITTPDDPDAAALMLPEFIIPPT
ncbi:MAG: hypothetical protein KDA52_11300 [Planctomycetaceae bacterium]|nr:hypothetical protein [Planctomycetaceae bacterium]